MNERDFINEILATEKYLTDNFNVFAREASNQVLHRDVMEILNESHQAARNLFNMMFKKGWYKLTAAQQQEIQQAAQQFQNYKTQEPY
ncbi:MAG: spore coat protein [Firmicutes bacterium]|nr:spore coat protein [Bacillota bacterium]